MMAKKNRNADQPKKPLFTKQGCLVVIAAMLIGGCVGTCTNSGGSSKNQAESSVEAEVDTTSQDEKTEAATDEKAEDTAATTEPEPEPAPAALTIDLVAGAENEYSRDITLGSENAEPYTKRCYFVPAGTYEATNVGDYPTQINVYSEETQWMDGNEEPAGSWASMIAKGETIEVEVPEGWYIYISEPTHLSLVQQ